MDDQRFGMALRAARLRRGWSQRFVAIQARVSDATVSRLERGLADSLTLATIRRVAAVLDVYVGLLARSRAGDLERVADAAHATLAEAAVAFLRALGWDVRPEISFSIWGERGVVDLVGWHAATRSLVLVELKTRVVDIGHLLATLDRRHRLGLDIARSMGWEPATISTVLILADSATNHRRVAAHRALFDAALPTSGRRVRAWLAAPSGSIRGLTYLADRHPGKH